LAYLPWNSFNAGAVALQNGQPLPVHQRIRMTFPRRSLRASGWELIQSVNCQSLASVPISLSSAGANGVANKRLESKQAATLKEMGMRLLREEGLFVRGRSNRL